MGEDTRFMWDSGNSDFSSNGKNGAGLSIWDKKISWYVSLIVKKLNKQSQSTDPNYSLNEIKKLINICGDPSVLLNVFINRYYEQLLPELVFIVKDAIKTFFVYSKVSVFTEKEIKLLKYAMMNNEHDVYCLNENSREKAIRKLFNLLSNSLKDVEYISSQYKYKSYQFAYQVQDSYMVSENNTAGQLDIKINDYVIIDPTKLLKNKKTSLALVIIPELSVYSLLSNRKKYCHKQCESCNTVLDMYTKLDNRAVICYKSVYCSKKECLGFLFEQLVEKQLFKKDMNFHIDANEDLLTIELDKDIVKQISVPVIRVVSLNDNVFEIKAFKFNYYKTFIDKDYFYRNYFVGMVDKVIKNEESIKYQKFEFDEDDEEDIQILDMVQTGIIGVLEYYTNKIDVDTISPLQFLKGFVMWYIYPFKKELKAMSFKKYHIRSIKEKNTDTTDNEFLDIDYFFNKNNAFMYQNAYAGFEDD